MLSRNVISVGEEEDVLCEVLNAREISLKFKNPIEFTMLGGEIIKANTLSLNDEISVPIDAEIESIYKIKSIEKVTKNTIILKSTTLNKSSKFLLPILYENTYTKEFFLCDTFLENVYISTFSKEVVPDLVLRYRYSESTIFGRFQTAVVKHPYYLECTSDGYNHLLYSFAIVDEFKADYHNFVKGRYSRFSDKLKRNILSFFNFTKDGTMGQILYKGDKRRKQLELELDVTIEAHIELYSIPTFSEETLTI